MLVLKNVIGSTEIAKIINKNRMTPRRWADSGKLPEPLYIGGVYLWDRVEVFKILNDLGYLTACNDENYNEQGAQK